MKGMMKAIYFMNEGNFSNVYGPETRAELERILDLSPGLWTRDNWQDRRGDLAGVQVLVSSWGAPVLDEDFLQAAPDLELVLYGAGSIRGIMTEAAWDRGIRITHAAALNAVPVAEFTLSQIIYCLKHGWRLARECREDITTWHQPRNMPGGYGSTVGVVSLGLIGRLVCQMLRHFDHRVIVYDPFAGDALMAELGVESASLEELFAQSDVVTIHTPWLPETEKMFNRPLFNSMKEGASIINTARGALVDEDDLVAVLQERPDLTAVLDVTHPEPPRQDSPLLHLPNVILTPHIAGAMGVECRRMGAGMCDEMKRYLAGEPLKWEVTRSRMATMA